MNEYDYKEIANQYDEQVKEYDSYGHDVIFGMCYEYVSPNEKILDLGIGTGLASIQFSKIGLKVYGLDIAEDMLNVCRNKAFAEELKLYKLSNDNLPYDDNSFNHIISCGVFHFLGDLKNVFSDVARVLRKGGIFGFTIAPDNFTNEYSQQMTAWGVPIFKHSTDYIKELLENNEMRLLKEQRLLIKGADKLNYDMLFSVMIAKYK
jgi:ubiquinone/menaquinone biosynthesis C-methylase UbiE